jgi:hypothetical protein
MNVSDDPATGDLRAGIGEYAVRGEQSVTWGWIRGRRQFMRSAAAAPA